MKYKSVLQLPITKQMLPESIDNLNAKLIEYQSRADDDLIQILKSNRIFRKADTRDDYIDKLMRLAVLAELKGASILFLRNGLRFKTVQIDDKTRCDWCDEKGNDTQMVGAMELFEKFRKSYKPPRMYVNGEIVRNDDEWKVYKEKWVNYHRMHGVLQCVCATCNKDKNENVCVKRSYHIHRTTLATGDYIELGQQ